jgi:hypothetical protein
MSGLIATLIVAEEVGVARAGEVVVAGATLPVGARRSNSSLVVSDESGQSWPVQVLAEHTAADGSVDRLAVAFPATVAAAGRCVLQLRAQSPTDPSADSIEVRRTASGCRLSWAGQEIEVAPGGYLVKPGSFLPAGLSSSINLGGKLARSVVTHVMVRHDGPLLTELALTGHFEADETSIAGLRGSIRIAAGRPSIDLDVAIVVDGPVECVELESWVVDIGATAVQRVTVGAFSRASSARPPLSFGYSGGGHARGIFTVAEVDGGEDWRDASELGYWDRWEWAELQGRSAQNWAVLSSADRSWTVAIERFCEHFPARVHCRADATSVELYVGDGEPAVLAQGSAPRRRLRVAAASDRRNGAVLDCPLVAFQPDALTILRPDVLPYLPHQFPRLESQIRSELFSWYLSGQQLGFYDHGDGLQGIGDGPRRGYSSNNEHDAIYALGLHYMRTGERAYLDSAVAYAQHTIDVDQIHFTKHPHELYGLRAHGKSHLNYVDARTPTGTVRTSIDTGHMWVEGLILLSQLTGEDRYLSAACRVGDCLLGLEQMGWTRPEPGPRNAGWPLIALSALARATGDERYLLAAQRIAALAISRQAPDGRWLMRLGYIEDYCAWQNSVLLVGLSRLLDLVDLPEVRVAAERGGRALLDLGRTPEGTFIYMTRFDYRWTHYTALVREALAAMHDLTGAVEFIRAGLLGDRNWFPASAIPVTSERIAEWRGHLPFLGRAHQLGLLQDIS